MSAAVSAVSERAPEPVATVPDSLPLKASARKGSAWPVGAWIALVGAASFGITLAVIVGIRLTPERSQVASESPEQRPEATASPPDDRARAAEAPQLVLDIPEELQEEGEMETEASESTKTTAPSRAPRPASANALPVAPKKAAKTEPMSAEQRALLDRFSGETGADPSGIRAPQGASTGSSARGEGLSSQQLSSVVSRNRPQLQRCYETAIRGMGTPPAARMDVEVTVGGSGSVIRAAVRGDRVGSLADCIERAVRGWRFPAAGAETRTRFPVVFQPGS